MSASEATQLECDRPCDIDDAGAQSPECPEPGLEPELSSRLLGSVARATSTEDRQRQDSDDDGSSAEGPSIDANRESGEARPERVASQDLYPSQSHVEINKSLERARVERHRPSLYGRFGSPGESFEKQAKRSKKQSSSTTLVRVPEVAEMCDAQRGTDKVESINCSDSWLSLSCLESAGIGARLCWEGFGSPWRSLCLNPVG